ncbi:MAG: 1-acyl-sn-glycerol-3-phosphate acyltransferase [Planctomycetales bacterium]|nr:1-acyl-sn-glycerol-3-phosphate acyltransferase [Planctomycetales bacterium]
MRGGAVIEAPTPESPAPPREPEGPDPTATSLPARAWYAGWRLGFRTAGRLLYGCRTLHVDRVPATGAVILAATHVSFLDPVLAGMGLPRPAWYLARRSLFRSRLFAAMLRSWHAIPVDRAGESRDADLPGGGGFATVVRLLRAGAAVVVFPEATRSATGEPGPVGRGLEVLARRAGGPVIPVAILGAHEVWPRSRRFPRPFGRIRVAYGEPIPAPGPDAIGLPLAEAVRAAWAELRARHGPANREP